MNKQDVKNLVDGMPQGMDVDDYLVELVNRALFVERERCIEACEQVSQKHRQMHNPDAERVWPMSALAPSKQGGKHD